MSLPETASPSAPPPALARRPLVGPPATSRRRLLADRAARWVVTAGGMAIIASILGILIFLLIEVWPLTRRARVEALAKRHLPAPAEALLVDEYRSVVVTLGRDGRLRALRLADGEALAERELLPEGAAQASPAELTAVAALPQASALAAATADGRLLLASVDFEVSFDVEQLRSVTPRLAPPLALSLDPEARPLGAFAVTGSAAEELTAAAQLADGRLALVRRQARENLLTGEIEESLERSLHPTPGPLTVLVVDSDQRNLFAGTALGELLWWRIEDGALSDSLAFPAGPAAPTAVTALGFLVGDRSLVVGQADGSLSVWFVIRQEEGEGLRLARSRDFPPHPGAIRFLVGSQRNRSFLALDDGGRLGLYYSTSKRTLWTGASPLALPAALALAPRADGAFLAGGEQGSEMVELAIANPHPETSFAALFRKVWYEGYETPAHAWQSTGGTDDFEPKLGLTPLLAGTLKGTFYSLLLAIPLGVLGAMYASQFMDPRLVRFIKPTVEIMAALPSVVLGFLAGLWLAPRLERAFPALLLMVLVLPLLVLAAGLLWRRLPPALQERFPTGSEVLLHLVVLGSGIWACLALSPFWERLVFDGSFQGWLFDTTGMRYDQRNAIVVGLAMGFAVIPIIFAIAEDAFSNVPRTLVAGSLALGANRWQTVTRVVLPTASPGIFSGIMVGFGRAVGETMIVLMATGNTPILSWSPFNGFRTLSANIAVEIPEAPQGGTLYRTLFLAALLLFLMTFLVNTAAELIRQRLRRRYAQL